MTVLIVLCAIAACAVAKPTAGYAYSAYAPLSSPFAAYISPYPAPYAYAAHPVVAAPVVTPVAVKTQYYAQDFTGHVSYGHTEPLQAQDVVQDAAGNKVGSFSYVNPDGKVVQTNYVADSLGYRVASNDLPIANLAQPEPVQDTAEVAEAKAKFFAEFEQTKNRAKRAVPVQTPASTTPLAAAPHPLVAAPAPIAYSTPAAVPYVAPFASAYSVYPYGYPAYSNFVYSK